MNTSGTFLSTAGSDLGSLLLASLTRVKQTSGCIKRFLERRNDIRPPHRVFGHPRFHTFFGYYDFTPFNEAESKLLAMQVDCPLQSPQIGSTASIGYFNLRDPSAQFVKVSTTQAWNWQQGCRLRWYPGKDETLSYNCLYEGQYCFALHPVSWSEPQKIIRQPLYDFDMTGSWGLSLNFSRLQRLRPGYGYVNLVDSEETDMRPKNDGIWLVDIHRDTASLLFSLDWLASIDPHDSMENAWHYVNHLSFSPSGNSFLFLHFWFNESTKRRYSRLFTADQDGGRLILLNNSGHVSHYTWLSDRQLVIITNFGQRQLHHVLYDRLNGFEGIIGNGILVEDGHPTFVDNGKSLLTDTYPDKFREQKVLLFDLENQHLQIVDRFSSPDQYVGEVRCDLHPRISQSEKLICIDTVSDNRRVMVVMDLSRCAFT